MAYIKSRQHAARSSTRTPVAGTLGLMLAALPGLAAAQAADAAPAKPATQATAKDDPSLPSVTVKSAAVNEYKANASASPKLTQPLLDTPKTIQVIKKEMLAEQGAASLMEALRNTPGITMQLGENGNTSAGDAFYMRGFSTQSSTFVDGIRDLGAVTRDVFNLDSVEVVKGPSGSEGGRGSSSGYINLVSKLPSLDDLNMVDLTLGSHSKKRVTADMNRKLGETTALRLNLMAQDSGVPGRDVVKTKGTGVAPSLAFGLGTPTRVFLFSQHLRQNNVPDGGIPTIGMEGFYNATLAAAGINPAAVDRSNYYGSRSDYEKVTADMFSIKFEHDVSPVTRVTHITRYGKTHMDRVLTGINTLAFPSATDPSTWTLSRSRQRTDQTNEILASQTNVRTAFETGGLKHELSGGVELMYERQLALGFGTTAQTINGVAYTAVAAPVANLYNPNPDDVMGVPYATGANTEGKTLTAALYAFDTLTINDAFKLNGGLRFERYNLSTNSGTIVTATTATTTYPGYAAGSIAPTSLSKQDNLLSWNVGAIYKPAPNGTVYAALANSLTPPGGANFTLSSTTTNQASPTMDPQETSNIELGTKWELLDKQLSLNGALYRTENDKQTSQDPTTGLTSQFGKTRVEGVELAAVGQLTHFWQVSAGVSKMRTKALDSYSVSSTTGAVTTTNAVRWSPDLSATVWTSYTLSDLTVGGGVRYMSEQKRLVTEGTNPATTNIPNIPGYSVVDLMAAYKVTKNINLRLNLYNLFDKQYVSAANNSGARLVLGAPRSASVSAAFTF